MLNKPKKSLGQNFLHDKNILKKIIHAASIRSNDEVLEVGPGTGNLTRYIVDQNPKKVYVIEKDFSLSQKINNYFKEKVTVISKDILKVPQNFYENKKLLIIGNLPYNISTKILSNWCLNQNLNTSKLILMFQKEVADRITAEVNTKEFSRITIISNWKFNIKKICDVSPECFYPKPKIKSTVLEFLPKKNIYKFKDPKNIEKVTKVFFNQRRKMIKKPINILFKNHKFNFEKYHLAPSDRPQNINVEKYLGIVKDYEKLLH
ncbi:16S rRNA (adenine(1518)-N(6)/adenine(1519)-N(6))-dimethyltransferase RsmA [Candidatus Pelagibacter communis]|uniref:16S rRNA (adenine(1518)-N(6)/adenine(1519)-N(6))- dimethyltransferase RsmA n=1 Tax=Pelagibacter ubique TaxID=198252 RepID=UPI00094D84C0|nr:16S rRNA (adenine(1518)-N(6)/adenine(1519)-N(6))-dimethyltransferase RsmA [Candidatus Pelagibacter ubique]